MKTIPDVIPIGWRVVLCGDYQILHRDTPSGLRATFSTETYGDADSELGEFYTGPGRYRRVVLSRKKQYPTWDEMRDFVYSCGLFDQKRAVIMVLPPPSEYVNMHPYTFHFFQKEQP